MRSIRVGVPGRMALLVFLAVPGIGGAAASEQAPESATAAGQDPRAANPDYTIGVEDLIQISVWKNPDLSVLVPVRPDGKISLPLIDDVPAAGMTPLQLKDDLTARWKAYLSAPEVSVIIKEVNSIKVYVVGEIARPGELRLKSRTRLLQALSLAGGFTGFADRGKIILLREAGGGEKRFEINYNKVVSGNRPDDNMVLMPGDTIVVP
jgi:polysaccharide export outer membrane protein